MGELIPSIVPNLTAARIKSLDKPGKYGDGLGLYLNIARSGSKSWIQRITIDGKGCELGLGDSLPSSSPMLGRKPPKAAPSVLTSEQAARIVHELNIPRWKNAKRAISWIQTLERHAFPVIGDFPVDQIGRQDALRFC